MRTSFLLWFVPDEIILLGILMIVFGYVVGLVPGSFFLGALIAFVVMFTPLLDSFLGELSLGWWIVIFIAVGAAFVRGGLGLLLGQRVADGLISHLLRDLVVLPFRMAGGMIRMICSLLRKHVLQRLEDKGV